MNKHKDMIIPDHICQNNKGLFVTVNPRNACYLEFSDNWRLTFLDQPQSDVVSFEIISFQIYKNLFT